MLVKKELKTICSDCVKSILSNNDRTVLQHFSLTDVAEEAKIHAPVLLTIILNIVVSKPEKEMTLGFIITSLPTLLQKP